MDTYSTCVFFAFVGGGHHCQILNDLFGVLSLPCSRLSSAKQASGHGWKTLLTGAYQNMQYCSARFPQLCARNQSDGWCCLWRWNTHCLLAISEEIQGVVVKHYASVSTLQDEHLDKDVKNTQSFGVLSCV